MDHAELTTELVLKRDIPWESYMANKLISGTCLQHLRHYDHKPESQQGPLLDEDGWYSHEYHSDSASCSICII
ncbi:hypothetical protein GUJ93_ZPchr0001g32467 [Zizania palustris]|uniref:Uncharacterized protein n=1 Tax=Zizania palustris TaxID=103762 RepID=A0A8J5VRK0_ZIZPA|nr:hypothetical protein GUJ93_ZPchr0001g32467 [Zizania palustris]